MDTTITYVAGSPLPPYMQPGSSDTDPNGGFVSKILEILDDWALDELDQTFEVVHDGIYGDVMKELVKAFQEHSGFESEDVDGYFGPVTREGFEDRFDVSLLAIAQSCKGSTTFIQPDGSSHIVNWD